MREVKYLIHLQLSIDKCVFREEDSILVFTWLNAYILSLLKLTPFQINKVNICTYMYLHLKLAFLYGKKAIKVYNTISFAW